MPGVHPSRLIWAVDVGIQATLYGDRNQVILSFELVNEELADGRNYMLSKFFSATLARNSNLRAVITSLTGKEPTEIDLKQLLGLPCLATVTHQYKGDVVYANIKGITAIPRGMEVGGAKTPLLAYDLDDPNSEVYDQLPAWVKHRISHAQTRTPDGAHEPTTLPSPVAGLKSFDTDIPF